MEEKKEKVSNSTIVITVFAIMVIVALASLHYYFTVESYPAQDIPSVAVVNTPVKNTPAVVSEPPSEIESFSTEVISFVPPQTLPVEIKNGDCQVNSIAQPYRLDAWKCISGKFAYDPCFSTGVSDIVYCKMDPSQDGGDFLIKITKPLPTSLIPKNVNNNWVWFLVLEDGTKLSPYLGTRPIVDGEAAFYGSSIVNGQRIVVIGDLVSRSVWTAQKKVLQLNGKNWVTQSSETVRVKTVWQ